MYLLNGFIVSTQLTQYLCTQIRLHVIKYRHRHSVEMRSTLPYLHRNWYDDLASKASFTLSKRATFFSNEVRNGEHMSEILLCLTTHITYLGNQIGTNVYSLTTYLVQAASSIFSLQSTSESPRAATEFRGSSFSAFLNTSIACKSCKYRYRHY
jgi:hypothetical protein